MFKDIKKQENHDKFIKFLIDNDVEFREFDNGHVRIFKNAEKVFDFWSTTNKIRDYRETPNRWFVGKHKFVNLLKAEGII